MLDTEGVSNFVSGCVTLLSDTACYQIQGIWLESNVFWWELVGPKWTDGVVPTFSEWFHHKVYLDLCFSLLCWELVTFFSWLSWFSAHTLRKHPRHHAIVWLQSHEAEMLPNHLKKRWNAFFPFFPLSYYKCESVNKAGLGMIHVLIPHLKEQNYIFIYWCIQSDWEPFYPKYSRIVSSDKLTYPHLRRWHS